MAMDPSATANKKPWGILVYSGGYQNISVHLVIQERFMEHQPCTITVAAAELDVVCPGEVIRRDSVRRNQQRGCPQNKST